MFRWKKNKEYQKGKVIDAPGKRKVKSSQMKESISPVNLVKKIIQLGVDGVGPFIGAKELAEQYIQNKQYQNNMERINALVKWELTKNFTSGFIINLGGILTLPAAIPASIGASWVLQIRMVAAMAHIGGYNIDEPSVRMLIVISLLGKSGREVLSSSMLDLPKVLRRQMLTQLPKKTLLQINQHLGTMLMRKAALKGFTRFSRVIPVVGGILGGSLDMRRCQETAEIAEALFQLHETDEEAQPFP